MGDNKGDRGKDSYRDSEELGQQELQEQESHMAQQEQKGQKSQRVKLDEIMKVMFGVTKNLLVTMLNSLFQENLAVEDTEINFENNEFVSNEYEIIRGDLFIKIQHQQKEKPYHHYHIELQTLHDKTMAIRMFEYGFSKAKEPAKYERDDETVIYIPRQMVIFIEKNQNVKDELNLRLVFPDGEEVNYTVPTIKYWEYGVEDIKEQKLYPLLPLQVFQLRYELEQVRRKGNQSRSQEQMKQIIYKARDVACNIAAESRNLYDSNELSGEDLRKILEAIHSIFEYLNNRYSQIDTLNEEVFSMIRSLHDPVMEEKLMEKGMEKGIEKGQRKELLDNIHGFLSDLTDYNEYKETITEKLSAETDITKLKKLLKTSARVDSVKEFLNKMLT